MQKKQEINAKGETQAAAGSAHDHDAACGGDSSSTCCLTEREALPGARGWLLTSSHTPHHYLVWTPAGECGSQALGEASKWLPSWDRAAPDCCNNCQWAVPTPGCGARHRWRWSGSDPLGTVVALVVLPQGCLFLGVGARSWRRPLIATRQRTSL